MISDLSLRSYVQKKTGKEAKMANFTLEDTSGSCSVVAFNIEDCKDFLENDSIVKINGRFDKSDRGDQILVNSMEEIVFDESSGKAGSKTEEPRIDLFLSQNEFSKTTCDSLIRIVKDFPGINRIKILLNTNSGKKLETYLPVLVDAENSELKQKLNELFGREVA